MKGSLYHGHISWLKVFVHGGYGGNHRISHRMSTAEHSPQLTDPMNYVGCFTSLHSCLIVLILLFLVYPIHIIILHSIYRIFNCLFKVIF